jgi:hypothetical protein
MKKIILYILKAIGMGLILPLVVLVYLLSQPNEGYGLPRSNFTCDEGFELGAIRRDFVFNPVLYTEECQKLFEHAENTGLTVHAIFLKRDTWKDGRDLVSSINFLYPQKRVNGKYVSQQRNIVIDQKSIKLDYKTMDGKTIVPLSEKIAPLFKDGESLSLNKNYANIDYPPQLKLLIAFDMSVDGRPVHFKQEYQTELATEYYFWEILYQMLVMPEIKPPAKAG